MRGLFDHSNDCPTDGTFEIRPQGLSGNMAKQCSTAHSPSEVHELLLARPDERVHWPAGAFTLMLENHLENIINNASMPSTGCIVRPLLAPSKSCAHTCALANASLHTINIEGQCRLSRLNAYTTQRLNNVIACSSPCQCLSMLPKTGSLGLCSSLDDVLIAWSMQQLRHLHRLTMQCWQAAANMQQSLQTCLCCLLHFYRTLAAIAATALQLENNKSIVCNQANVWYRIGALLGYKHERVKDRLLSKDARAFILSARSKQLKYRARMHKRQWTFMLLMACRAMFMISLYIVHCNFFFHALQPDISAVDQADESTNIQQNTHEIDANTKTEGCKVHMSQRKKHTSSQGLKTRTVTQRSKCTGQTCFRHISAHEYFRIKH